MHIASVGFYPVPGNSVQALASDFILRKVELQNHFISGLADNAYLRFQKNQGKQQQGQDKV
ncbi:MAG: hypothetical protein BWX83_00717 [Candidatus Cloacimonetes bacterium ADurb.Bin117]|nr:MAG: hypothetical protein BWX83_00717 [Candidatus Cloacimonetes bacterium ADurb.Bin117]